MNKTLESSFFEVPPPKMATLVIVFLLSFLFARATVFQTTFPCNGSGSGGSTIGFFHLLIVSELFFFPHANSTVYGANFRQQFSQSMERRL